MTAEDRMIARFTKERMKRHSKKNIFNLDDDEVLTHHGQTLNDIEKFDNPASDDEDEEERGKLEADFVEEAHFGGGILKKVDGEKPNRKDLIEQLIAESKKRKAEKQRVREQTLELTEKLDTEWKDLLPIVAASKKKDADNYIEDNKPDSYDTVMRQLKFEARGKPSDPLESEESLAKKEQERMIKLEAERLQRMSGFSDQPAANSKHRSADDLDDGFEIESDIEETICYDAEGRLQGQKTETAKAVNDQESDGNMEESDEEITDADGSDNTDEEKKETVVIEGNKNGEEEDGEEEEVEGNKNEEEEEGDEGKEMKSDDEEEEKEEGSGEEEEDEDSLSDLKHMSDSETESESPDNQISGKKPERDTGTTQETCRESDKVEVEYVPKTLGEKEKRDFIETVKKKFPLISQVPVQYEDLQKMLESYSVEYQSVIVEHIMRSNHSGLNEGNKRKLETLFAFLLQYLHDAPVPSGKVKDSKHCFALLNHLAPHMYDLAHMNPVNAWRCVIEVLKEKQQQFRKHSRKYPSLDTLIFLKVISLLFPTSDFRHPVVTPALVFMCQMLLQCRVKTKHDIASGLFLVALMLEYTVLSKRFSPAAVNFLRGVLYSAIPKTSSNLPPPVPPFKKSGGLASLLVLSEERKPVEECSYSMLLGDLSEDTPIDDSFRIRALCTAVSMLKELHENLEPLSACGEIFKPIQALLSKLELDVRYPSHVKEQVQTLLTTINKRCEKKLQLLVVEKTRAKALRLYEPHFEKVFDGRRKRPMGQEKQEHEKLVHKYKREEKAALREIRRDNSFIAKLKWKDTLKSDMERNKKVKEIFGAAATQQGELRKLKRKK
ncbi:nucleolar protein 14 isoform X2 [Anabrus simplex]